MNSVQKAAAETQHWSRELDGAVKKWNGAILHTYSWGGAQSGSTPPVYFPERSLPYKVNNLLCVCATGYPVCGCVRVRDHRTFGIQRGNGPLVYLEKFLLRRALPCLRVAFTVQVLRGCFLYI